MAKNRFNKVQYERFSQLTKYIQEMNYPSSTILSKLLECHPATIKRDVTFLKERLRAPIEYDPHKKGYYITDKTYKVRDVLLTESELFAITTMLPLMDQYKNTPLENSFKSVFEKIEEMLPTDQMTINSAFIDGVQFIADPAPKIDPKVFTTVFKAIREKKALNFEYKSSRSNEYKLYSIDPYKVVCHKASWYVIGFSHRHDEFRIFSLSRFQACEVGRPMFFREDFEEHIHIDQYFGVWNNNIEPIKIELLFVADRSTYITEREWYPNQECYQNKDGTVYLSFTTNQEQEVMSWILSFGSKVKVLNPPELKEKIRNEILKAAEQVK